MEEQTTSKKMCCKGCGKKCWIVLAIVALVIVAGLAGFYLYKNRNVGEGLGCIKLLPPSHCSGGKTITYMSQPAIGFNVPVGTEIIAPFDGIYSEKVMRGEGFVRMNLGIPNTDTIVTVTGYHAVMLYDGSEFKAGDVLGVMDKGRMIIDEESNSNLVIYTTNYDLANLFEQ
jgi:hypothetical protein